MLGEQAARTQTLTKRNLLITHRVEAWCKCGTRNKGLELGIHNPASHIKQSLGVVTPQDAT